MSHEIGVDFCPCADPCPLQKAMSLIGGKWKLRICCVIYNRGSARFSELKTQVKGITNTVLTSSLKQLEANNLVIRTQYNEIPVRVEYTLTKNSEDLLPVIFQLGAWAASHDFENVK